MMACARDKPHATTHEVERADSIYLLVKSGRAHTGMVCPWRWENQGADFSFPHPILRSANLTNDVMRERFDAIERFAARRGQEVEQHVVDAE